MKKLSIQRNSILVIVAVSLMPIPINAAPVEFLTGATEGDPYEIVMSYIRNYRQDLGLTETDLTDIVLRDRYTTKHNGVTHIYLQQRLDGIEVYNAVMNFNVARDGSIISFGNSFISNLASKANPGGPAVTDRAAIERAAAHFGFTADELTLLRADGGVSKRATFSDASLSRDEIPAELVYQPLEDGTVRLAWQTVLNLVGKSDWWSVRVDAGSGDVISQHNWSNNDSYLVIEYPPFSDPEDSGGQTTVVDPANLTASPFAWHDTDGIPGGEFTDTRGNNVFAQEDLDGNNSGGFRPDGDMGGPMLDFNFVFDPADQPTEGTNLSAAITNLFYANNVMHDLTYQYGFDEASGNFQNNNYGNGGAGGDQVLADALDNAEGMPPSCGNANFSTPPDGVPGRMQMFLWQAPNNAQVTANTGPVGDYTASMGCWGGALDPPTTADIEQVDDGSANPTQGCGALIGFTAGNIALIDRGSCEFGDKAIMAENAGASAAIIVNDQQLPNGIINMGAGAMGANVTIPAVMIGAADGDTIKAALGPNSLGGVNATVAANPAGVDRDSDFDNGIIAHEYGHGISNRLTGGGGNSNCLGGTEQAGEGWSDFWTLVLGAKISDTPMATKGVGNYVTFNPINGPGIRNFPYTTDLAVNPQTYADIAGTNVPHGVGEIWMSMVWEVYWELVTKHGFDPDLYNGTGGNNLTIQLVIDGMKMQNCRPNFVQARDAILMADMVNNGGANQCEIWRGFAKRCLGVDADAGPSNPPNIGDETEGCSVPPMCPPIFTKAQIAFRDDPPDPDKDEGIDVAIIHTVSSGAGKTLSSKLTPKGTFISSQGCEESSAKVQECTLLGNEAVRLYELKTGTFTDHTCIINNDTNLVEHCACLSMEVNSVNMSLKTTVCDSDALIFSDGFESGDTSRWSLAIP